MDFQRFFRQSTRPATTAEMAADAVTTRRSATDSGAGSTADLAMNFARADPKHRIELRRAKLGDLPALTDLLTHSFHGSSNQPFLLQAVLRFSIQEDLRQRLQQAHKNRACWVAIRHSTDRDSNASPQLVGTIEMGVRSPLTLGLPLNFEAWLTLNRTFLYISNLAVATRCRRQGIAQDLLRRCEQTALAWQYPELYLHVLDSNQAARNLYHQAGFGFERVDPSLESVLFNRDRRQLWCKKLTPSRSS